MGGVAVTDDVIIQAGSGYDISCGVLYLRVPELTAADVADENHCGSRGYGWQTANHYFYAGAELRGLPKNRREESWLHADEPLGREYWAHHNSAANYAVANRHVIVRGVQSALDDVFSASGEAFYEISHNLVQQETLVLPDGTTQRGFVHRKGATRPLPEGHPDLAGHFVQTLVDVAALVERRALRIAHHTADRHAGKRARDGAPSSIEPGIRHGCPVVCHWVLRVLEDEGIARVAQRLYPVANIKGSE